ncbi:DNA mismatch repair endonuclease MutL [Taibaiella koreensis]|uniref:DNA mismatch repair endonuclease MutL n=1 Tax=Taibaiella koreensis TaxID=1268548 RepID=UPI000E59ABFB|nr:DNA mismatch repair endonuclease MutL [Taibaiella koreensis]
MPDIIQLLPDHLANQIAAGEVIQRPASAVKELLENAIDAGATEIQLIIKDAGKELIQVVDNGKGMTPMDARMSFERHATSKIRHIDDLFSIRTMGFRGEALASIAAVAQVDLKTRPHQEEIGTHLVIEASEVLKQEPAACPPGTSFAIRNLFYNVPARRKFLKSNTSEYKHIIDEFTRVAMAYPHIAFRLFHNNTEQFRLSAGNQKTRIVELLGNKVEKTLVPVEEDTELLRIHGFIGKPESATRTRGNQFFFINGRFIRNAYLHHAVATAFEGLIDKEAFPFYVLFLELDPQRVDVNVHPTKQEVKFDDDRLMYAYLQSTVKHALARFNIAPALDFTLDTEIQNMEALRLPQSPAQKDSTREGYLYQSFSQGGKAHFLEKSDDRQQWNTQREKLFTPLPSLPEIPSAHDTTGGKAQSELSFSEGADHQQPVLQWRDYLISTMKSGLLIMHQKRALERIQYERLLERINHEHTVTQQLLFPATLQLSPADAALLEELLPFLRKLGYDISPFGSHTYAVQGAPPDVPAGREQVLLEEILEQLKHEAQLKDQRQEKLLRTMAKRMAQPTLLATEAAAALIDELFACAQPQYTPDGARVFTVLPREGLENLL